MNGKRTFRGIAVRGVALLGLALSCFAGASHALEWRRVETVPASDVFSVQRHGASVYAGASAVVYIGEAQGTVWIATAPVDSGSLAIEAVVPAGGALWAGTFGRGVFRSDDGGASWNAVNAGFTGLGSDAIVALVEKSGTLCAGTGGAGIFALPLATAIQWTPFNAGYPVGVAGTVQGLVLRGTTLVAAGGGNGFVYRFLDGATSWQEAAIVPPIAPGLVTSDLLASGTDLFAGTSHGVYRSSDDGQTWTGASDGLADGIEVELAAGGAVLFAAVNFLGTDPRVYRSADRGVTWREIDRLAGTYVYALEVAGERLFAARTDGLWWTPVPATPVQGASWGTLKAPYRTRPK